MDTIIRRWHPLSHASLVHTLDGDGALGDLGTVTLRRSSPAATSGDVAIAGGTVRLTLSAWDGGTAVEAIALSAPAAAARQVLRAVDREADRLAAAPRESSTCCRGRRAALSPAHP